MNRNVVYVRFLLVIIAIAIVMVFINRSPRHNRSDAWLPSSYNPVGSGSMALFQTLQELNWPVERWREPLSRLSDFGTGNVLIITRSQSGTPPVTFTEQEAGLLDAWVQKGNTLLLLGAFDEWDDTRALLGQFGFALPKRDDSMPDFLQPFVHKKAFTTTAEPAEGNPLKGALVLANTLPLSFTFPANSRILWQEQGQPFVLDVPLGNGHVIYGASAQLLDNASLGQGDNLAIVLQLLRPAGRIPDHIFFEESHHGYSASYALARLLGHPGIKFAALLALLAALTFFGSSFVRFGQVIPHRRESGRSTLEFVDSIADLYLRADLRNETMKYLFTETHQRVLHRLNLPPTASHELIATRLEQTHPQLPKWKKLARRFDSADYTDGLPPTGWLRVARDLIEIKSAMA